MRLHNAVEKSKTIKAHAITSIVFHNLFPHFKHTPDKYCQQQI